jgi:oligopeptide/dipeptide ABC transporter ATP-binding protein
MKNKKIILNVNNLSIGLQNHRIIPLVEDITFSIFEGETFGLIGESGCGKTITSLGITGTLPEPNGIYLNGKIELYIENKTINILTSSLEELRKIRGSEIGVIFQEPFMALNPLYTIEFHFKELYKFHQDTLKKKNIDFEKRLNSLLKRAGFSESEKILKSYPHQLSGGMLQRIVIILAILLKPKLIIADEPTTSLDVTIQAQIMELLNELKQEENTSILLITHNMGLLAQYADRLAVMYAGRIVEKTDIDSFLKEPLHPYSQGLLQAIPELEKDKKIQGIPGNVPSPENYPEGCRFINRCPYKFDLCERKPNAIIKNQNHIVYCWKYYDKN